MKSIPVRDAGLALMNLTATSANRKADAGDFQKIWSNQMNKGAEDKTAAEKQNTATERKTENSRISQNGFSRVRKEDSVQEETAGALEEMTPEEAVYVAEMLGQTAMELVQQIADVFGITVEEVQTAMEELELMPMDLLDVSRLTNLLLQLGGAQDVSALVMDETLYSNYQLIMGQLQRAISEDAGELNKSPEEVVDLARLIREDAGSENSTESIIPVENEAGQRQKPETASIDEPQTVGEENQAVLPEVQETLDREHQEGRQSGEDAGRSGEKSDGGEHVNLLIQTIRSEQFEPEAVQTDSIVQNSPWTAQTRDIMNQIMDYMRVQLNPDTTSLEMQLHPASLGTLQVQIASKSGVVTANFITQNEAVKAALESQMVQLRESFEEQGVKVEAIEVTVQTHEFERNLEQGRGRNQQEPEKRNRTRRIHLGGSPFMEVSDEGDTLTAEMMRMDGNTVDYTA